MSVRNLDLHMQPKENGQIVGLEVYVELQGYQLDKKLDIRGVGISG